jgi:hypothetical protein
MASTLWAISFSRTSARFSIDAVAASRVRERDCRETHPVTITKPSEAAAMPAQIRATKDFLSRRRDDARTGSQPVP